MGSMARRFEVLLASFSLVLGATTVLLQRLLHPSIPRFQSISIMAANDEQFRAIHDEQTRQFHAHNEALIRGAHIQVTALTLLALVMLYLLYKRRWSYDWAEYVILASAIAICIGLLLSW